MPKVKEIFQTEIELVMSYHNKETFGDMDILVYDNGLSPVEIKELISKLNPAEINRTPNSNVYSFDYKNLQIDLIFVLPENWEASKIFFRWGDLGNLMGKIFNSYGGKIRNYIFKYGFDGIKVKLVYESKKKVVYLSKDNREMFKFLGLDFDLFMEGFDDQYEMFDYILTSKYFSYDIFQWENLSAVNKQRNKKRQGFHEFLEYIEKYKNHTIEWVGTEQFFIDKLNKFFGVNLQNEMQELIDEVEKTKSVREKFSGNTVIDNFGIKGRELGLSMKRFREFIEDSFPYGDYEDYILKSDINVILYHFKKINNIE